MTGGAENVVLGPCNAESLRPDLQWLEETMSQAQKPKMVVRKFCGSYPQSHQLLLRIKDLNKRREFAWFLTRISILNNACANAVYSTVS